VLRLPWKGKTRKVKGLFVEHLHNFIQYTSNFCTTAITPTIKQETEQALVKAVNIRADQANIRVRTIRNNLIQEAQTQFQKLQQQLTLIQPKALPLKQIKAFYKQLLKKNPTLFYKIRRLKGRRHLYPEDQDMHILAEAADIAQTNSTFLISNDYDFTAFTNQIWTQFKTCVISLRWIPINKPEIKTLIKNPCLSHPLPPNLQ